MRLLMVFFKQEAIEQIIYLVRCQISKMAGSQRFSLKAHWLVGFSQVQHLHLKRAFVYHRVFSTLFAFASILLKDLVVSCHAAFLKQTCATPILCVMMNLAYYLSQVV